MHKFLLLSLFVFIDIQSAVDQQNKIQQQSKEISSETKQEPAKPESNDLLDHPEERPRVGYDAVYYEERPVFIWAGGQGRLDLGFMNRSEVVYGRSLQLLSKSKFDQTLYFQTTTDMKMFMKHADLIRARLVIRNKYRAGDPESLGRTSESTFKITDVVTGEHEHFLGKLIFWMREGWLEIKLNDLLQLKTNTHHFFKIGIFPFELGRGISLGDAFAVQPGIIGFYSNNVIDQYAFGGLFHGEIVRDRISYDAYFSILRNLSDSFRNVNEKVFANEIGRRDDPRRGFGDINLGFAGRLMLLIPRPFCSSGDLTIEPYIFINRDPEQKVEFIADASSKLATPGLSIEYEGGEYLDWGVEFAANFGHQHVRGWDRNKTQLENRDGQVVVVFNKVLDGSPDKKNTQKALITPNNKKIVNNSAQGAAFNGKEIGNTGLFNSFTRFRDAYDNFYKGAMFVADVALKLRKNVKLTSTFGVATGDENPNRPLRDPNDSMIDGDYQGFVPFQSIYSGKRVLSLFFLGTGRIARPLSVPATIEDTDRFASTESGFTNLIFFGFGSDVKKANWRFRPNILWGWQQHKTKKFDLETKRSSPDEFADRYLGFEINIFAEVQLAKQLKGFIITGFFIPGTFYKDTRGKPLAADQIEALNNVGCDGLFGINAPPLLSDHPAFLFNTGLEFSF